MYLIHGRLHENVRSLMILLYRVTMIFMNVMCFVLYFFHKSKQQWDNTSLDNFLSCSLNSFEQFAL